MIRACRKHGIYVTDRCSWDSPEIINMGDEAKDMKEMDKDYTDFEIDALKEIGNVGVGNAATSLSNLLNRKIGINLPDTKFVKIEKFADEIGGAERIVVSLYLQISGDLNGECIFIFPEAGALELIDLAMGTETGTTKVMTEMEESVFKEISNIFTGSYLNSLSKMLDMQIMPSVPHVATDMAQSIIDFLLIKLARSADQILCVKTAIDIEEHNINGQFIMLFEDESLKKIVQAVHTKYGI